MFLRKRCSCWTTKSYQTVIFSVFLCSWLTSVFQKKNTNIAAYLRRIYRIFLIITYFWISFNSRNFDLKTFLNHLFNVSIVNFSSEENSSDKKGDFCRAKLTVAASFSCWKVTLSKNRMRSFRKWSRL